jgi:peptidoglycan/xylan/chitin deacetylase (PgdA/CDA1 family)
MSLLVFAYTRARPGIDGNSPEMLDEHLAAVAANCDNVLPGESLRTVRPAACLCFDGAFYDFFATALPLLEKYRLRALLAVAPALIRDRVTASPAERIAVDTVQAYRDRSSAAFCTWSELEQIAESGRVAIAAHGSTHRALTDSETDLEAEVHVPRTLLTTRLHVPVESFVLPFGRHTPKVLDSAKNGYDYVFGNGQAVNVHWQQRVLHRVDANNLAAPDAVLSGSQLFKYHTRRLWNRLCAA